MNLEIRQATNIDVNIIFALAVTTCYEAYFELDPSTDLADYCALAFNAVKIKKELEDTNATFLIAESDGKAVAYAKLRENNIIECLQNENAIEVQRIYVLEKLKGKHIGAKLMNRCFEIAHQKGYEILWLGVWDKNIEAQKFYEKLGMSKIGTTDFSDGKSDFINLVLAINV